MPGWVIALVVVLAFLAFTLVSNLKEIRLIFRGTGRGDPDEQDDHERRVGGRKEARRLKK